MNIKVRRFSRDKTVSNKQEDNTEVNANVNDQIVGEENNDDMFADLNNENYVSEDTDKKQLLSEKEKLKLQKEELKLEIARRKEEERSKKVSMQLEKMSSKKNRVVKVENNDDIFSDAPTEIMGLSKRGLLKKVSEYKALFPELKNFKIKKNPTEEDLKTAITEMDAIVSTSSLEGFMTDSILHCLQIIEGISSRTKYNVSGMSEMLRENQKFNSLCKQMYLKYGVFTNIPVEQQLIMIIGTTAMIAKQKNDKISKYNSFLDEKVTVV